MRSLSRSSPLSDFEEHDYSALWRGKQLEDAAQKHLVRSWLEGDTCVELGGGFGRLTQLLESKFSNVVMLEFANRNISMARRRLRNSQLVRTDVSHLPLQENLFDCAVMVRVIHLLPDPAGVMMEIQRVVRDRGTVIISVPNLQMNRLSWGLKEKLLPKSMRNRTQTYGHAAWPFDERPLFLPHRGFVPASFKAEGRRGTGLFDNYLGKMLGGMRGLYLVDVATSPLWFLKLDVFLKFRVLKAE